MTPDPVQLPQLRTPGQNDLLPPASHTTLVLTVSWRLVLTLISGTGLVLMFGPLRSLPEVINQALYFTTISNILVFLVALAGVLRPLLLRDRPVRQRLEGNQGWLRGLTACAALLTGLVFGFIMAGDLSEPVSFIPHLVLPVLAVVGLLSFISSFGDFVIARVVLQTQDQYTLAVGMYAWASDARNAPWGIFAAGAVIAAVPVVLLFQYLQKYIVSGLTAGAVKG